MNSAVAMTRDGISALRATELSYQKTPTTSVVSTRILGVDVLRSFVGAPVEAWHPNMSTNNAIVAVYGVTDDEQIRLSEASLEESSRQIDTVERLNDHLKVDEEVTVG